VDGHRVHPRPPALGPLPGERSLSLAVGPLAEAERPAYLRFLSDSPDAGPYHHPDWWEALRRGFGYEPLALVARADSAIVGALPLCFLQTRLEGRRLVALPFSHRVLALGDERAVGALAAAALEEARRRRCRFVEIRSEVSGIAGSDWVNHASYVNTALGLPSDDESHYRALRPNTRQQLDQALHGGELQVVAAEDEATFARFARVVLETRRRLGSLTYPRGFYRALLDQWVGSRRALFELAVWKGRDVAALATLAHGQEAIYAYGGATEDAEALRRRPMNLLLWRSLCWARAGGARRYEFGTSLPSQEGLIRFKEGFGGRSAPLAYTTWIAPGEGARSVRQDAPSSLLASRFLKMLPASVYGWVAPRLLRQFG
jgi:hypothetical protein